jgi:hypothetical protein
MLIHPHFHSILFLDVPLEKQPLKIFPNFPNSGNAGSPQPPDVVFLWKEYAGRTIRGSGISTLFDEV